MTKDFFITSKSEAFRSLRLLESDSETREREKKCLVFGKKMIGELDHIEAFITLEDHKNDPILQSKDRYILSPSDFKKLSGLVNPEPYGAVVKITEHPFPQKIKKGILIFDEIRDPGNVGTLFRTAWGLGIDALIFLKHSCDPYNSKIIRSSKAVCLKMPFLILDKQNLASFLSVYDLNIYRADLRGQSLEKVHNKKPFALILGNESQGISKELKSLGQAVHIPQNHLESYNVAIAGAIISYALIHKGDS
jgi:RNA methyltransferase, TrmH family